VAAFISKFQDYGVQLSRKCELRDAQEPAASAFVPSAPFVLGPAFTGGGTGGSTKPHRAQHHSSARRAGRG
tara:strand:- start:299 stop:511 length:213 start_codon:yes stop_codon:yes gene_type:complete